MSKTFTVRTASAYLSHKKRAQAAKATLDYDLGHLRTLVKDALECICPYCQGPMKEKTWSSDHATPTSRGGKHSIANLIICCKGCNLAKGNMTIQEFRVLLGAMKALPPEIRTGLLARLRRGGRFR